MSRLYEGDGDSPAALLWDSNVKRGMKGKRGQKFLRELRDILLAMPEKRLVADDWITPEGEVCVLDAYLRAKDERVKPEHSKLVSDEYYGNGGPRQLAEQFNLPWCMLWDIEYGNDNCFSCEETPEQRHERMLKYVSNRIIEEVTT